MAALLGILGGAIALAAPAQEQVKLSNLPGRAELVKAGLGAFLK